ncbi:MAG: dienelactone hydrolase family protein [Proteobacteria bacterium]|nr:dienelactone hydrolase family protein [Pseudomonadota bacterium]
MIDITTEKISIPVSDGNTMGGYLARPSAGGTYPAVIVYMEIFGVNSHIRDVTERIASEGYVAIAPDYFHRTGPGVEYGYDDTGMAEGMKLLGQLKSDEMIADARAAIAFLRGRSDVTGKVGAMGFCIGGHMTYLTACETDVAASASYYGGGIAGPQGPGGGPSTVSRTGKITGRILCHFGGPDTMIPQDQVDAIRKALEEAAVRNEVVVYADADHGFNCSQRASYHKASADDAWQRTFALFREELGD